MTTNERLYLRMLMNENRWNEAIQWMNDKQTQDTKIYLKWLRDGQFDQIQDDNNGILAKRKLERRMYDNK